MKQKEMISFQKYVSVCKDLSVKTKTPFEIELYFSRKIWQTLGQKLDSFCEKPSNQNPKLTKFLLRDAYDVM